MAESIDESLDVNLTEWNKSLSLSIHNSIDIPKIGRNNCVASYTIGIDNLPPDTLFYVCLNLKSSTVSSLALVCRYFRDIAQSEEVWSSFCRSEFGVKKLDPWIPRNFSSFRQLYCTGLSKCSFVLGLWHSRSEVDHVGHILNFVTEEGRIIGKRVIVNDLLSPISCVPQLEIIVTPTHSRVSCFVAGYDSTSGECSLSSHSATISLDTEDSNRLRVSCSGACIVLGGRRLVPVNSDVDNNSPASGLLGSNSNLNVSNENSLENTNVDVRESSGLRRRRVKRIVLDYLRLLRPVLSGGNSAAPTHPLEGIFRGVFGIHGVQVVAVTRVHSSLRVRKLTGDINVPAGAITLSAQLSSDSFSSLEGGQFVRTSSESIIGIEERVVPVMSVVPPSFSGTDSGHPQYMTQCYPGKGMIAAPGFRDPEWTPGYLIIFNKDSPMDPMAHCPDYNSFGFCWTKMQIFSFFLMGSVLGGFRGARKLELGTYDAVLKGLSDERSELHENLRTIDSRQRLLVQSSFYLGAMVILVSSIYIYGTSTRPRLYIVGILMILTLVLYIWRTLVFKWSAWRTNRVYKSLTKLEEKKKKLASDFEREYDAKKVMEIMQLLGVVPSLQKVEADSAKSKGLSGKPDGTVVLTSGVSQVESKPTPLSSLSKPAPRNVPGLLPPTTKVKPRTASDKIIDWLVGQGPNNTYALICKNCFNHNGLTRRPDIEQIPYICPSCNSPNGPVGKPEGPLDNLALIEESLPAEPPSVDSVDSSAIESSVDKLAIEEKDVGLRQRK